MATSPRRDTGTGRRGDKASRSLPVSVSPRHPVPVSYSSFILTSPTTASRFDQPHRLAADEDLVVILLAPAERHHVAVLA